MSHYLTALLFSAALLAPLAVTASAEEHRIVVKRYYDREGRDWHQWNEAEERAYRRHLAERRLAYRPYHRIAVVRQREYWRWRHQHPEVVVIERR
jgi:hypothetical protein